MPENIDGNMFTEGKVAIMFKEWEVGLLQRRKYFKTLGMNGKVGQFWQM